MNPWMTEAVRLARLRAPLLSAQQAYDLADDLHKQCPDWLPAKAVAWFFSFMPPGWNGGPVAAQDLPPPPGTAVADRARAAEESPG